MKHLEQQLSTTQLSKNKTDDDLQDLRQNFLNIQEHLELAKKDLLQEQENSKMKIASLTQENTNKIEEIRQNFEKEKFDLISRHDEKCSRLELECAELKDKFGKDRLKWDDILETRKQEDLEERKKWAEEKEHEKVGLLAFWQPR